MNARGPWELWAKPQLTVGRGRSIFQPEADCSWWLMVASAVAFWPSAAVTCHISILELRQRLSSASYTIWLQVAISLALLPGASPQPLGLPAGEGLLQSVHLLGCSCPGCVQRTRGARRGAWDGAKREMWSRSIRLCQRVLPWPSKGAQAGFRWHLTWALASSPDSLTLSQANGEPLTGCRAWECKASDSSDIREGLGFDFWKCGTISEKFPATVSQHDCVLQAWSRAFQCGEEGPRQPLAARPKDSPPRTAGWPRSIPATATERPSDRGMPTRSPGSVSLPTSPNF